MRPFDVAERILLTLKRKRLVDIPRDEFVSVCMELCDVVEASIDLHPELLARDVIECLMVCDGVDELYGPDDEIIPAIVGAIIRSGIRVVND